MAFCSAIEVLKVRVWWPIVLVRRDRYRNHRPIRKYGAGSPAICCIKPFPTKHHFHMSAKEMSQIKVFLGTHARAIDLVFSQSVFQRSLQRRLFRRPKGRYQVVQNQQHLSIQKKLFGHQAQRQFRVCQLETL